MRSCFASSATVGAAGGTGRSHRDTSVVSTVSYEPLEGMNLLTVRDDFNAMFIQPRNFNS